MQQHGVDQVSHGQANDASSGWREEVHEIVSRICEESERTSRIIPRDQLVFPSSVTEVMQAPGSVEQDTSPAHPIALATLRCACARPVFEQSARVTECVQDVLEASARLRSVLGPGVERGAYRALLAHELRRRGLMVWEDVAVAASYQGMVIEEAYRADLIVEGTTLVDLGREQGSRQEVEARLRGLMTKVGVQAAILAPLQADDSVIEC